MVSRLVFVLDGVSQGVFGQVAYRWKHQRFVLILLCHPGWRWLLPRGKRDGTPSGSGQLCGSSWIDVRQWGQRAAGTPIVFLEGHRRNRNGHPRCGHPQK